MMFFKKVSKFLFTPSRLLTPTYSFGYECCLVEDVAQNSYWRMLQTYNQTKEVRKLLSLE